MALAFTNLTSGGDGTDTDVYTTASVAPTGNRLLLLTVFSQQSGDTPPEPTVAGNGLTWVVVETNAPGFANRTTVFRAMGASPSSGAITITHSASIVGCSWSLDQSNEEVDTSGTNGSGAIVQSDASSSTSSPLVITLSAFGSANNVAYGGFGISDDSFTSPTVGSGFTGLATEESNGTGAGSLLTEYKANDATVDMSWSFSPQVIGVALEIKAASTASAIFRRRRDFISLAGLAIPIASQMFGQTFARSKGGLYLPQAA